MAEEQQKDDSGETLKLLAKLVAALEQQTAEQSRRHEQRMELARRNLALSEDTNRLYRKAVEQQETSAQRHQDRLARLDQQQKKAQRWAVVILIFLAVVFLASLLLPHHVR